MGNNIYEVKNFDSLLGLAGFSDTLLKNHFTLYQGYVANTNKLIAELKILREEEKANTPAFAELKRRFGWEFNGLRLHEYYFANLNKNKTELKPNGLRLALETEFGSLANWEKDFRATSLMRGIGWVILAYDQIGNRLFNVWVNEHDTGHLGGGVPIMVLDVFEHAYMLDYGLKKADYLEACFKAFDWKTVEKRFAKAKD